MAVKIQHPDDRSRVWVAPFIEREQENAIVRMIEEFTTGSMGVVNGSNMDTGKTLQASEVVHRMRLQRVLYIGVKDTFAQWADRLDAQSDGAIQLRRMDSTKLGKLAFEDAMNGLPGHYFTGSQWLTAQDWESRETSPFSDKPIWKQNSKGEVLTKHAPVGQIGPQLLPIRNTEQIHKKIFHRAKIKHNPFDLIIFDEVHVISNRKSVGRRTVMTIPTLRKLAMSGTWYGNKFENAWSITRWTWPDIIETNFDTWSMIHCEGKTIMGPGGELVTDKSGRAVVQLKGERNEGAFADSLPCYIRIDGELEVPDPELVYVDLLPEQRADYDDLERDLLVWLHTPQGQRATLVRDLPITLRAGLRTATLGVMSIEDETGEWFFADDTKSTKLYALRGVTDRPDWINEQVVIGTDSKRFAKVVVKRMRAAGYNAVEWSGDVDSDGRDKIKAAFLNGEIQYLVTVIASFSTGLDGFQMVCNKAIVLSETDNNIVMAQWIKRLFRRGRKDGFQWVKIVARDTYDVGVLSSNVVLTLSNNASMAQAA